MSLGNAAGRLQPSGLVVALVGFVVTRFLVAETLRVEGVLPFLVGGFVPLTVGLGLAVFGVALTVGTFPRQYVRTVAWWCLVGTGGMVLVLGVTALQDALRMGMMRSLTDSGTLVANVLLGGAVGGVLLGDRAALNDRQRREIRRQANRGIVLNRLLRHEVLNAAAIVKGYASTDSADDRALGAIREAADRIEATVEDVGTIAEDPGTGSVSVDAVPNVEAAIESARDRHPGVTITARGLPDSLLVRGDDRLDLALRELVGHAAENADTAIEVAAETRDGEVSIRVTDDGPSHEPREYDLLSEGEVPEYDDPSMGFSLQLAWLLVDYYGGRIDLESTDGNSTFAVVLPAATPAGTTSVGVTLPDLYRATVAGLFAGTAMGLFLQALTGLLPVIGALYGVESPVVGWTTHLFHSVVFALLFAAGCEIDPVGKYADGVARTTVAGVVWGGVLAIVAAGVVMPVWLRFVGLPAVLPNVSVYGLLGHLLWGGLLGGTYATLRVRGIVRGSSLPRWLRIGDLLTRRD